MSGRWRSRLEAGGIVLIDGATGSELRRRGVALDPIAWSASAALTHPDQLAQIHADYLCAGAEIVTTNTFATTRFVLEAAGLDEWFAKIQRAAVAAARRGVEAAGREAEIAGSISCLPPGFDPARYPSPTAEKAAYRELAETLAALGVDLLVLEMMEDVEHGRRACEAAREVGLPFWIGISARLAGGGDHAPAGSAAPRPRVVTYDFPHVPLADVLDALLDLDPAVVNVMHTPADAVLQALAEVAVRWHGHRGAYPELGEAQGFRAGQPVVPSPAELAALAAECIGAGAHVLGGCCGTTPAHIAAVSDLIARLSASR